MSNDSWSVCDIGHLACSISDSSGPISSTRNIYGHAVLLPLDEDPIDGVTQRNCTNAAGYPIDFGYCDGSIVNSQVVSRALAPDSNYHPGPTKSSVPMGDATNLGWLHWSNGTTSRFGQYNEVIDGSRAPGDQVTARSVYYSLGANADHTATLLALFGQFSSLQIGKVRGSIDIDAYATSLCYNQFELSLLVRDYNSGDWNVLDAQRAQAPSMAKSRLTLAVNGDVPANSEVQLQLRIIDSASQCSLGASSMMTFEVVYADLFGEECIPDQSNPDHCLE